MLRLMGALGGFPPRNERRGAPIRAPLVKRKKNKAIQQKEREIFHIQMMPGEGIVEEIENEIEFWVVDLCLKIN